jgi:hypothetical protein
MQVNGKQVDALQWLRETGGVNAEKRLSTPQPSSTKKTDKITISKDEASALKNQMQIAKAGVIPGANSDTISSYLTQLKALAPTTPSAITKDTNTVTFTTPTTNTASAKGKNNTIDFRSEMGVVSNNSVTTTGNNNIVRGYNGGQKNNTMAVTGDTNRIYAGQGVSTTAISVKGEKNNVTLAENASNNKVSVSGNNVKVSIGTEGLTPGSNQNWNISVAASNMEVTVTNGKASVNMAEDMKDKYKVTIDDAKKTVSVTPV